MKDKQERPIDWEKAINYLGGDQETAISLLEKADAVCFDDLLPKMYDSLHHKHWDKLSSQAAILRDSCSYMAAENLVKSCSDLEKVCRESNELQEAHLHSRHDTHRDEILINQSYLEVLGEVKKVKSSISEIIHKPADFSLIEEQEKKLKVQLETEQMHQCCGCMIF